MFEIPGMLDISPRCKKCGRQLAIALSKPWIIRCPRCKEENKDNQEVFKIVHNEENLLIIKKSC